MVLPKAMKAMKAKKAAKADGDWELRPFSGKESGVWKSAVKDAQRLLKQRKREHPALFMLAAVGKHLYEAAQSLYKQSTGKGKAKAKKTAKTAMKAMKAKKK
eukprot:TRINITY_DN72248_c0_g1_i1.p3 TRINITY_DN72248_c0_g1~~TRINITY_DN72248_c0_g1_i1.p3  ORF type:complete len:102 (+),score=44.97 TRINITY_DN72248_c0_g1_i1:93-398(+)